MPGKYENIVMLVHPLYDLIYNDINDLLSERKATSLNLFIKDALKDPKIKHQLITTITEYRKELLKYQKDPATLLLIYLPTVKNTDLDFIFKRVSKELIVDLKKIFKERLIISTRFSVDNLISEIPLKNFSKKIQLKAFGEYKNICVTTYLDSLANQLEQRGFKTRSKILARKSYSSSNGRFPGLDHKARFRSLRRFVKRPL
jgi:hypothetical protein